MKLGSIIIIIFIGIFLFSCAPSMKDMPKLQKQTQSSNEKERLSATEKIGEIKNATPEVLTTLNHILKNDGSSSVRSEAAKSIGNLGFQQSHDPLSVSLKTDSNNTVRNSAVTALYTISGANAINNFIEASNDENSKIRFLCVKYLGNIGGEKAASTIREKFQSDPSPEVRAQAVKSLGKMKDKTSYELIKKSIKTDSSESVRVEAVKAIGNYPGADSMKILCEALENSATQKAAIDAIYEHKRADESKKAISILMKNADEDSSFLNDSKIVHIFIDSGDNRVKPYFRQYITYEYCDRDNIRLIATTLKDRGDTSLVPALCRDLDLTNESATIINLCTALGSFDDNRATSSLLSKLQNRSNYSNCVPTHIIHALEAIKDPKAANYLCQMCCNEKDKKDRQDACQASSAIVLGNPFAKLPKCPCWNK